jgi:hypothetical protein
MFDHRPGGTNCRTPNESVTSCFWFVENQQGGQKSVLVVQPGTRHNEKDD